MMNGWFIDEQQELLILQGFPWLRWSTPTKQSDLKVLLQIVSYSSLSLFHLSLNGRILWMLWNKTLRSWGIFLYFEVNTRVGFCGRIIVFGKKWSWRCDFTRSSWSSFEVLFLIAHMTSSGRMIDKLIDTRIVLSVMSIEESVIEERGFFKILLHEASSCTSGGCFLLSLKEIFARFLGRFLGRCWTRWCLEARMRQQSVVGWHESPDFLFILDSEYVVTAKLLSESPLFLSNVNVSPMIEERIQ